MIPRSKETQSTCCDHLPNKVGQHKIACPLMDGNTVLMKYEYIFCDARSDVSVKHHKTHYQTIRKKRIKMNLQPWQQVICLIVLPDRHQVKGQLGFVLQPKELFGQPTEVLMEVKGWVQESRSSGYSAVVTDKRPQVDVMSPASLLSCLLPLHN